MLCLGLLAHYADTQTVRDERRQQEMVASFTARTLGMRIDTYQRVLQSMGQGIHSSMLDTPYLLELLLREEAGYAGIFDTLVMAGNDGSMVSYAPSGGDPAGGSALRDVLRRTLTDGKPQVSQMTMGSEAPQLGLLLTVPLRQGDGAVRGALAGVVRMGLSSLLPQPEEGQAPQRWLLVEQDGLVLADSQRLPKAEELVLPATASVGAPHAPGPTPAAAGEAGGNSPQPSPVATPNAALDGTPGASSAAAGNAAGATLSTPAATVQRALGISDAQWRSLSSSATANADSQLWDSLLVTRVGLPLPRWQVLAVRDLSPRLLGQQRLTPWQWLALVCTAVAVALALLALLWWVSRPLRGLLRGGARAWASSTVPGALVASPLSVAASPLASAVAQDETAHIRAHWQALEEDVDRSQRQAGSLESAMVQLLETLPGGAIWEQDDVLLHVSRRAAALLGRDAKPLQGAPLHQLLYDQPGARQWVQHATVSMASFGHCRGELPWKLAPGATRWLQVQGQCFQAPAQGNLWRIDDAEVLRQRRRMARWQDAHDAATGLPNRFTLQAQLQSWCDTPPQPRPAQALLWLDVDYFTALNATAGRAAGDEVLRQVAWLLQREQGALGMAARVEADAFVLWLRPAGDEASVQTLAWRLCAAVQGWAPQYGGQRFVLGLSVGWWWSDAEALDAEQLLRTAEAACREAKRAGQGRAVQVQVHSAPHR